MNMHPQIIEKEGKKEFVLLPYEEFLILQKSFEDYEDIRTLQAEKKKAFLEPTKSLDAVLREIEQ